MLVLTMPYFSQVCWNTKGKARERRQVKGARAGKKVKCAVERRCKDDQDAEEACFNFVGMM